MKRKQRHADPHALVLKRGLNPALKGVGGLWMAVSPICPKMGSPQIPGAPISLLPDCLAAAQAGGFQRSLHFPGLE